MKKPRAPTAAKPPGVPPENSIQATATQWQGPLPPPDALQKFDQIVLGGAERVFRMAELEQQHRIESERAALDANISASRAEAWNARFGLILGASVSLAALLAAIYSVSLGANPFVSIAIVGVPLMAAVKALIVRK